MPTLLLVVHGIHRQRDAQASTTTYAYAVTGPQSDAARQWLTSPLTSTDSSNAASANTSFTEVITPEPQAALQQGKLQVIVETGTSHAESNSVPSASPAPDPSPTNLLSLRLVYRGDRESSLQAQSRLDRNLRSARTARQADLLADAGFPLPPSAVLNLTTTDIATPRQSAGQTLGRSLTLLVLFLLFPAAAVLGIPSLAGERERGTLETLLTTAASRPEIIGAKLLSISLVSLGITAIQMANVLLYIGFRWIPLPEGLAASVTPGTALALVLLHLPLAVLAAAVLVLLSALSHSIKEAQLYFVPAFLLCLAPAAAAFLPDLPLTSLVAVIPVSGLAIASRDLLTGDLHLPAATVAWGSTTLAALALARLGVRHLSLEPRVASHSRLSNPTHPRSPFEQHVLRWFAGLWATLLIVSGYYSEATDLRLQILVNVVGLFLGGSLLILRLYRLHPPTALALRVPRPSAWVAVLVGVPGGLLAGIGLFRFVDLFLPIPPQMLEAFSEKLFPHHLPFWQWILFLAVLPGICEEIAFRGLLLHGLRRRTHPVVVILVVGLVFGFFHMSLFRLAPTAFLGILLATVTLLTGSILPAIAWHILHNATSLAIARASLPLDQLHPAAYAAGALLLALALTLLWRERTPYPDLRPAHPIAPSPSPSLPTPIQATQRLSR
jgi:sodium transport system permease protein